MSGPLTDAEKVAAYEDASRTGFKPIITKREYDNLKMSIQARKTARNNKREERDDGIDDIDRPRKSMGRPSTPPTRSRARSRSRTRAQKRTRSRAHRLR